MGDEQSTALTVRQDEPEMSVEAIKSRVMKIAQVRNEIMVKDVHYGTIPGVDKPCLYKPGAEILCMTFRAIPKYSETRTDLPGGHREIKVVCELYHQSGAYMGSGVGSCSTMESKYRWRRKDVGTDVGPVPKAFWDTPKDDFKARQAVLAQTYGPGKYKTKKTEGQWTVMRLEGDGEKEENQDIADTWNTVLKMAKKRAFVDATITAFSVSDSFTQDVDEEHDEKKEEHPKDPPKPQTQDTLRKQIGRLVMNSIHGFSREEQEKARAFCDEHEHDDAAMKAELDRLSALAYKDKAEMDAAADEGFDEAAGK
jgi:hypothetical protein